jgi:hypothetical protein
MCLIQREARQLKLYLYVAWFVLTSGEDEIVISYNLTILRISMAVL